jgi:hypothetical protein
MNLILHKDTVYETVESQYYTGHQPVKIVKGEPTLSWKGGKIPMDEWSKILSFFKWSYDETKSETQVRLLYSPDENKWVAWAFPQEHGTGMTTKEIDGEMKDKQREQFSGYIVNGTVHHHCSSPAFQSGTDKSDEESQDGLHITIGNLASAMYDLHSRVCRSDVMYSCSLKEWFEFPDEWNGILPSRFINHAVGEVLVTPPESPEFPEEWKDNLIKVAKPVVHYGGRGYVNHASNNYWKAHDYYQNNRTQFDSAQVSPGASHVQQKLPQTYTDGEKKDAMMDGIKEWVSKHGEELKMDAMDLPDQWENMLMASWLEDLIILVNEMGIEEAEFEGYCQDLMEKECSSQLAANNDYPHQLQPTELESYNNHTPYV